LADRFPAEELVHLQRVGTYLTFAEREVLMEQRSAGTECVVVIDGTLSVERDGVLVATVGAGEVVGELALLTDHPRNATVVAEPGAAVYVLNRREFTSVLDHCPAIAGFLLRRAVQRIAA
jgi:CRP-like cAMP-binding protein